MTGKHYKPPRRFLGALRECLRSQPHQIIPPPRHLGEIVDGRDGWAHLATEEAYEQGLRNHTGHYMVLCGHRIPVASMAAPPEHLCLPCHELGGRA